jgi:hypothetical protein
MARTSSWRMLFARDPRPPAYDGRGNTPAHRRGGRARDAPTTTGATRRQVVGVCTLRKISTKKAPLSATFRTGVILRVVPLRDAGQVAAVVEVILRGDSRRPVASTSTDSPVGASMALGGIKAPASATGGGLRRTTGAFHRNYGGGVAEASCETQRMLSATRR